MIRGGDQHVTIGGRLVIEKIARTPMVRRNSFVIPDRHAAQCFDDQSNFASIERPAAKQFVVIAVSLDSLFKPISQIFRVVSATIWSIMLFRHGSKSYGAERNRPHTSGGTNWPFRYMLPRLICAAAFS